MWGLAGTDVKLMDVSRDAVMIERATTIAASFLGINGMCVVRDDG